MTVPDAELLQPTIAAVDRGAAPAERAQAAAWVRLAPLGLAVLAAVLYGWNLTVSGYANTYYSAAAQAAGQSVSAWFFGALDAASFITVDKPPVSLWAMGLSVRLFGLSPFAVLLPQALAGVASVVLLYAVVRRQLGPLAGVIAGAAFALTPVAVLMFRYNDPDAVLVLLLIGAVWAFVRGLEHGAIRWAVLAAVLVGFAFLTKYLQAYLVLPAFAVTWLVAAPGTVRRRLLGLVAAGVAVVVASMWWVVLVELLPAASRPFIGGSPTNSAVQLLRDYDGLGRILGGEGGGGRGPGGAGGFGGDPGLLRMFNEAWGGEVSWLLPGAAIGLVAGLISRGRAARTDRRRAGFLLWGSWAIVHGLVFSLMTGIAHPYYAVALAPALAALFGGGIAVLWGARRRLLWARVGLAGMLVVTAAWSRLLLERTPDFVPGLGLGALAVAIAAGILLVVAAAPRDRLGARLSRAALIVGVACVLVGPVAYAGATMSRAIAGGDPVSGPVTSRVGSANDAAFGAFGGQAPGLLDDVASDALIDYLVANRGDATWLVAVSGANQAASIQLASGVPVMAMGGFMGSDPAPTLDQLQAYVRAGTIRYVISGGPGNGPGFGGFGGGDGAPLGGGGGIGGGDGVPGGGVPGGAPGGGGPTGDGVAAARTQWVTEACTPVRLETVQATLYDCAGAAG